MLDHIESSQNEIKDRLAQDKIKKQEKEGDFSEDQSRDEQDVIQKTLDKFISELEKHLASKEADILKV